MPNLFVGPDPRALSDFEALREMKITAILSLQTAADLRDRGRGWEERSAWAAQLVVSQRAREGFRFRRPPAQVAGLCLGPGRDAQSRPLRLRPLHGRRQSFSHGGGCLSALAHGVAAGEGVGPAKEDPQLHLPMRRSFAGRPGQPIRHLERGAKSPDRLLSRPAESCSCRRFPAPCQCR